MRAVVAALLCVCIPGSALADPCSGSAEDVIHLELHGDFGADLDRQFVDELEGLMRARDLEVCRGPVEGARGGELHRDPETGRVIMRVRRRDDPPFARREAVFDPIGIPEPALPFALARAFDELLLHARVVPSEGPRGPNEAVGDPAADPAASGTGGEPTRPPTQEDAAARTVVGRLATLLDGTGFTTGLLSIGGTVSGMVAFGAFALELGISAASWPAASTARGEVTTTLFEGSLAVLGAVLSGPEVVLRVGGLGAAGGVQFVGRPSDATSVGGSLILPTVSVGGRVEIAWLAAPPAVLMLRVDGQALLLGAEGRDEREALSQAREGFVRVSLGVGWLLP